MSKRKKDVALGKQNAAMPAESPGTPLAAPAAGNNTMDIHIEKAEDGDAAVARVLLHPVFGSISTARNFEKSIEDHNFGALIDELNLHIDAVKADDMSRAEKILVAQATSLDIIYNSLVKQAGAYVGTNSAIAERYLRMGLKAQSQCRCTIEALAEIKFPKSMIITRQANVGQNVQVNNGNLSNSTRAREKNIDPPNELLTESHNATLDSGRTGATSGNDPHMEAVGAIDGTENGDRKTAQQQ